MLLSTGCPYKVPLTHEHTIPIDSSVLGIWYEYDGDDKRMLVLPYSDTEYLINYGDKEEGFYFRAYLADVGGLRCVQLELVGNEEGIIPDNETRFHVASYSVENEQLEVKLLNSDLVDEECESSEALMEAFLENIQELDLFDNPGTFTRKKGKCKEGEVDES